MDTIMIFMFTHKKDGDRIEELVTIEELIYGIGDSKQPFKEYIEAYAEDGYKISNVEVKAKEEISLSNLVSDFGNKTEKMTKGIIYCAKDYITNFCSFTKDEIYQISYQDEYGIALEDNNGQAIHFSYYEAKKYLFE